MVTKLHPTLYNGCNCLSRFRHKVKPWWCHQMATFSALMAICAENSPVPVISPHKGQWSFNVFFHLRLNKRLSKQSWGWWFETLSSPLWRHRKSTLVKGSPDGDKRVNSCTQTITMLPGLNMTVCTVFKILTMKMKDLKINFHYTIFVIWVKYDCWLLHYWPSKA